MEYNYNEFKKEAENLGYFINNDIEFVEMLLKNIKLNNERYGYDACPCRLASGEKKEDLDLICPCDYRDADLNDYGTCFCALYVTKEVLAENKEINSIPDRRFNELNNNSILNNSSSFENKLDLKYPFWRCKVCGYLCSREKPPEICPICKVDSDRFERII